MQLGLEQMERLNMETAPLSRENNVENLTDGLGGFVDGDCDDVGGCDIAEVGCCWAWQGEKLDSY